MKYKDNGVFKELLPVAKEGIKYEGTYEVAPTGWSIVSSEEDCTNNSILYFIADAESSSEETGIETTISVITDTPTFSPYNVKLYIGNKEYDIDTSNHSSSVTVKIAKGDVPYISILPGTSDTLSNAAQHAGSNITVRRDIITVSQWGCWSFTSLNAKDEFVKNEYKGMSNILTLYDAIVYDDGNPYTNEFSLTLGGGQACLAEDTEIATIDGFEKIKDLKLGDKVLDENDEETTIEKIYGHIIYNPYVITLDNNEVIVCSHDHKFKTQNGIKTADSLTLEETLYNYRIVNISVENKEQSVYEIRTTSENYKLANGIICECEVI